MAARSTSTPIFSSVQEAASNTWLPTWLRDENTLMPVFAD
jgi:hypothetical protein